MHRHDPARHAPQQFERVVTGDGGIARIVVDAEVGIPDGIDERTKQIHLLGELGILPEVVLVVILDDQRDPQLARQRQAGADRLGGEGHALLRAQLRPPLSGERPAPAGAERVGHPDPGFLFFDLALTEGPIGVGEVGGAAEHRDYHPACLDRPTEARPGRFVCHLQESGIPLEAVDAERRRQVDPLRECHAAILHERLHVGLRKGCQTRDGRAGGGGEQGHDSMFQRQGGTDRDA